jgi:hypothetical protein
MVEEVRNEYAPAQKTVVERVLLVGLGIAITLFFMWVVWVVNSIPNSSNVRLELSELRDYETTGGELDVAVSSLSDAFVDKRSESDINKARIKAVVAVERHRLEANDVVPMMTSQEAWIYAATLSRLDHQIETVDDLPSMVKTANTLFALVKERQDNLKRIRKKY